MCCILCEEPVRTITFGLAAVGIVAIVNGTRKLLTRESEASREERQEERAAQVAYGDRAS
jgi:hypothetical protein